jgi:hypothetical protein
MSARRREGAGTELGVRGRQWHAVAMRTYGQYCPVARAAELLAERWSIIILRNILVGCLTFNEIADGAPVCRAVCSPSGCGIWSAPG